MASGGAKSASEAQQLRAVKNYVSEMLGDPEETRKMLVQNIAANIFENLKKNSEMKDILKDLLLSDDKKTKWFETQKAIAVVVVFHNLTDTVEVIHVAAVDVVFHNLTDTVEVIHVAVVVVFPIIV